MIEDSLNGVRTGLAAGMEVWRFVGGSHLAGLDLDTPEGAGQHASYADFAAMRAGRPDLFRSDSDRQDMKAIR